MNSFPVGAAVDRWAKHLISMLLVWCSNPGMAKAFRVKLLPWFGSHVKPLIAAHKASWLKWPEYPFGFAGPCSIVNLQAQKAIHQMNDLLGCTYLVGNDLTVSRGTRFRSIFHRHHLPTYYS